MSRESDPVPTRTRQCCRNQNCMFCHGHGFYAELLEPVRLRSPFSPEDDAKKCHRWDDFGTTCIRCGSAWWASEERGFCPSQFWDK